MKKSPSKGVKPDVYNSRLKNYEVDFVAKSMEEVMKGLQAIRSSYKAGSPTGITSGCNEVQMTSKQPDLLQEIPHSFRGSLEPSNALRGRGNTSCIPMFNGESSRAFLSWLYEVECFFDGKCYSEKMKLEMVLFCLKGFALLWYNGLKLSRMVKGKDNVSTWCELKSYMKQNFLPSSILDKLWIELKTFKQNSFSVNKYAKLFGELHLICDENVDCVQKGVRFYHGLKSEIAQHIDLEMKYTFDEVYDLALCVEKRLATIRENENLLVKDSLEFVKTVLDNSDLDQVLMLPCVNVMVEENACIESEIQAHCVLSLCDEMRYEEYAIVIVNCTGSDSMRFDKGLNSENIFRIKLSCWFANVQGNVNEIVKEGSECSNGVHKVILIMSKHFVMVFDPGGK